MNILFVVDELVCMQMFTNLGIRALQSFIAGVPLHFKDIAWLTCVHQAGGGVIILRSIKQMRQASVRPVVNNLA